jgi:YVTN family beta-propeller protein
MKIIQRAFPILLAALAGFAARAEQRLYVLNSLSDDMTVIDVASDEIIASVPVGPQPHGIASPASQDVLYVSTERDGGLTVVDLKTNEITGKYPVLATRPNEIEVTSDGRFVYAPIFADGEYRVLDTRQKKVVATLPTPGGPHNVVVSPDDRYMYLAPLKSRGEGSPENTKIYVADVRTHSIVDSIELGNAPRPVVISPDGKRLYVNTDNLMGFLVVDTASRKVVAQAEYPLTDEERASPSRSHGIGVTPDGREVWSTDINHGVVHVFDVTGETPKPIARMPTGNQPLWLTVSKDGKRVFVSNKADDTISVFDVATKREVDRIQLEHGKGPQRILVVDVPLEDGSS